MRQRFKKVTRTNPAQDPPGHYSTANSLLGPRGDLDPSDEFREFRNHRDLPPGPRSLLSHPMMASGTTAFLLFFLISKENFAKVCGKTCFVPEYQITGDLFLDANRTPCLKRRPNR